MGCSYSRLFNRTPLVGISTFCQILKNRDKSSAKIYLGKLTLTWDGSKILFEQDGEYGSNELFFSPVMATNDLSYIGSVRITHTDGFCHFYDNRIRYKKI